MSDTPKTDKAAYEIYPSSDPNYDGPFMWVEADFARDLERQLAEKDEKIGRLEAELEENLREDAELKPHYEAVQSQLAVRERDVSKLEAILSQIAAILKAECSSKPLFVHIEELLARLAALNEENERLRNVR